MMFPTPSNLVSSVVGDDVHLEDSMAASSEGNSGIIGYPLIYMDPNEHDGDDGSMNEETRSCNSSPLGKYYVFRYTNVMSNSMGFYTYFNYILK